MVKNTVTPISSPLVWSWVKNFASVAPAVTDAESEPLQLRRRQDMQRLKLVESTLPYVEPCLAPVLPYRTERIPNVTDCLKCGWVATFRKPDYTVYPVVEYIAPHAGVRPMTSPLVAPELLSMLENPNYGFVVATDTGSGAETTADRGAVYEKDTHALVATLYRDDRTLKVRMLAVSDPDLMPGAGGGVAMSAKRNEVTFFDAQSYLNLDHLAMRRVSLDLGYSSRHELALVGTPLAGPVVSAAYRDLDDSYFILSRGGNKVALHQVDRTMATKLVAEWSDNGSATAADLTISEEGVVAVTRRSAQHYGVFVFAVDPGLQVERVAYLTGNEPLALPAMITPEGLLLERGGPSVDAVVPLTQEGQSSVTYVDPTLATFEGLFQ